MEYVIKKSIFLSYPREILNNHKNSQQLQYKPSLVIAEIFESFLRIQHFNLNLYLKLSFIKNLVELLNN